MLETPDLRYFGRSDCLHVGLRAIHQFWDAKKRYPDGSEAEAAQVYEMAVKLKPEGVELEESVIKNFARFAKTSITSTCAFFGGIVA
jgi:hypothetical protein